MEEDRLVLAQLIESSGDHVAGRGQPRRRASDEAALLMSASFQPRIEQREVRAAMIDLVIVMANELAVASSVGWLKAVS